MNHIDERAKWTIARLTEQSLGVDVIPNDDLDKIIETIDFLYLHSGSLELQISELRSGLAQPSYTPQWQRIEFNEDGEPTNVPADTPILVPQTKRLGMTVAKWNPLDGWETETTSEWVGMYRPTHWQLLPAAPEVP